MCRPYQAERSDTAQSRNPRAVPLCLHPIGYKMLLGKARFPPIQVWRKPQLQLWASWEKVRFLPLTVTGLKRKIPNCESCWSVAGSPFLAIIRSAITKH